MRHCLPFCHKWGEWDILMFAPGWWAKWCSECGKGKFRVL